MKVHRVLGLGLALALPFAAMAELPFSKSGFGQVESALDFCVQSNPQAADKYNNYKKHFIQGVPGKEIEEARKSEEYQKAYKSMTTELSKAPKDQTDIACAAFLEIKN